MKILVIGFMLAFSSTAFAKERASGTTIDKGNGGRGCCTSSPNFCKSCDSPGTSCGSSDSDVGGKCRMNVGGAIVQGIIKNKMSQASGLGTLSSGKK